MQVHQRGAARHLCVAVGHRHDHAFLQAQHVAKVRRPVAEHAQLGGAGVAEDGGHAERAQQMEGRLPHRGLVTGLALFDDRLQFHPGLHLSAPAIVLVKLRRRCDDVRLVAFRVDVSRCGLA